MANPRMLRIDLALPRPVYEQIVSGLRALLVAGEFVPGEQLPTVRQLATDLGVHHNTVAESYRLLADEGWLDLRRGRGAVVLDREKPRPITAEKHGFRLRLEELIAKAITDGVPRSALAAHMAALAKKLGKP
ncbi:MAG TPA: GntR family transcriptional regulator [Candidatus Acidoferrales bacterium]|nr:GntR family transcriptional regulator [Candidatus Acidoferrales bacterium]